MPARRDDVAFGFDPRPFVKGLGVVTKGLGDLTKRVSAVAGQVTRRFIALGAAFVGLRALWGQFNKQVPEFGKAFSIAGDIIFKNLFWPLRTMLVPMLQKMLDWVRDHRTMFVRWGQTIENIFRGVINLGKQLIGIFRTIIDSVGPAFKRVFGGSFQDFLNVVTVKLAVALEFVGRLVKTIFSGLGQYLGPIVENIAGFARSVWDLVSGFLRANEEGNSFWTVLEKVAEFAGKALEFITRLGKEFIGGFAEGLRGAMTPIQGIVDVLTELLDLLIGADDKTKILSATFRTLGQLLGVTVVGALSAVWATLIGIKQGIMLTAKAIEVFTKIGKPGAAKAVTEMEDMMAGFRGEWANLGSFMEKYAAGQAADFKKNWGIGDRAPAVQAEINPKNLAGMEGRRTTSVGPVAVNITVNGAGDPGAVGVEVEKRLAASLLGLATAEGF